MRLAVDHPVVLALLVLCIAPLLGVGARRIGFSSLAAIAPDLVSTAIDFLVRFLAALAMAAIIAGLAGLHQRQMVIERAGTGAHIIVVLDRSLSMDENFALRGEKATESKTAAAARMIGAFFNQRLHDRFGLIAFSTSPILSMPLTEHREALAAAIAAMRGKALGNTDIGAGISMALSQFSQDAPDAAHVILLVSDGAGVIPEQVRLYIQGEISRVQAHLYYLYLRAGDDPPLANGAETDSDTMHPAGLDAYFRSLDTQYEGFEARDANAVGAAIRRIAELETHRLTYKEVIPRRPLDPLCYIVAIIALTLVLLARGAERGLRMPAHPAP